MTSYSIVKYTLHVLLAAIFIHFSLYLWKDKEWNWFLVEKQVESHHGYRTGHGNQWLDEKVHSVSEPGSNHGDRGLLGELAAVSRELNTALEKLGQLQCLAKGNASELATEGLYSERGGYCIRAGDWREQRQRYTHRILCQQLYQVRS